MTITMAQVANIKQRMLDFPLTQTALEASLPTLFTVLLLSSFLLFTQVVELVHSHDSDLSRQFDCEICLKIGLGDDAIPAQYGFLDFILAEYDFFQRDVDQPFLKPSLANSRAPPLSRF